MAFVTERIEDNILYLELNGRIDSSNANQAEEEIKAIKDAHPGLNSVLDAEHLEYLSSAGLRVILRMRKETADLKIINVNSEVYEILDMTGFTDMLTVEKAFRRLSVDGCEVIARGGNGAVYRYDAETIVKIYHNGASLEEIRLEGSMALKVTHEKIGNHMGTAREVVTRMLRYFQGEGMVRLTRGTVEITDIKKLEALSEE